MSNYIAIIHKEANSDYGVSFPDFPGCVTAGSTIDEAKDLAHEILPFHYAGMLEDGEEAPVPSMLEDILDETAIAYFIVPLTIKKRESVRVNFSIEAGLLSALDHKAHELGISRSGFIARSVRKELHT